MAAFREYADYDGLGLAELIRKGEVGADEVRDAAIERIEALNPTLNAVVTRTYDQAQAAREGARSGPLAGVPFLLKDLGGAQGGVRLTAGSRFFEEAVAPFDAEIVKRYKQAGLTILGRTSTPEFGLSATTEPVLFGPCRNPWQLEHTTGGSSGGSAAAVAAGMVPLAHASDGGGSIRIPAACCGLFGLKPTRARNSMAPYAGESLAGCAVEHVVSRSVRDSAAALDATCGPAAGDPYFAPPPARPYLEEVGDDPGRLRIAIATRAFNGAPVTEECADAVRECAALCADLGHDMEEATPDYDAHGLDHSYDRVFAVGAAANVRIRAELMRKTIDPSRFERVTLAMFERAKAIGAAEYVQLVHRLHAISRQVAAFFESYDLLLTPALAEPPVRLGVLDMMSEDLDAYAERLWRFTPFTYVFNVTGQPAMSVPFSWTADGLPLGVQVVARYGDEATLFRLAAQLERARPWAHRRPPGAIA